MQIPVPHLQHSIQAVVRYGETSGYVAECLELPVVTQAATLDDLVANLREAVALQLMDEDPAQWGLVANPALRLFFELDAAVA